MLLERWARNWTRSAALGKASPTASKTPLEWLTRMTMKARFFFAAALRLIRVVKGQRTQNA